MKPTLTKAERKLLSKLGSMGGKARVAKLTPQQISDACSKAGEASKGCKKPRKKSSPCAK